MEYTDPTPPTHDASLFVINDPTSSQPHFGELEVNNRPLCMEVDMIAAMSLAPEGKVTLLYSATKLKPSSTVLKIYTGNRFQLGVLFKLLSHMEGTAIAT